MKGTVWAVTALRMQTDMVWCELWEFAGRCLSSHLHTLAKMTWVFMSISVKDLGFCLLLQMWHPVAVCLLAPFEAFWKVSK